MVSFIITPAKAITFTRSEEKIKDGTGEVTGGPPQANVLRGYGGDGGAGC